jgi:hypothetical protein
MGRGLRGASLALDQAATSALPSRGIVPVRGSLAGVPFQADLQPDGRGGHWLKVPPSLLRSAGVALNDAVPVELAPVPRAQTPEAKVPPYLRKALAAAGPKATGTWSDITPAARRDWVHWIVSAKQAPTRDRRIAAACDMLAKGKRRPCCFDRSGMYGRQGRQSA